MNIIISTSFLHELLHSSSSLSCRRGVEACTSAVEGALLAGVRPCNATHLSCGITDDSSLLKAQHIAVPFVTVCLVAVVLEIRIAHPNIFDSVATTRSRNTSVAARFYTPVANADIVNASN